MGVGGGAGGGAGRNSAHHVVDGDDARPVLGYAAEDHVGEDIASAPFVDRQISASGHHGPVPWSSFDVSTADARELNGYRLIGRLVRQRRHRRGITQRTLGRLSGVDQSVISRLEHGRLRSIRWSRFAAVVHVLGGLGPEDVADEEPHR